MKDDVMPKEINDDSLPGLEIKNGTLTYAGVPIESATYRPRCKTCLFWARVENEDHGDCRFNAPRWDATNGDNDWGHTKEDMWCGQHPEFEVIFEGDGIRLRGAP
jgi:hypothetical protein